MTTLRFEFIMIYLGDAMMGFSFFEEEKG